MDFLNRGRRRAQNVDMALVEAAMQRSADEGLELQLRILRVLAGQLVSWSDEGRELFGTATGQFRPAGSGITTGQAQFRLMPDGKELWTWPTRVAPTGRLVSMGQTVIEVMTGLAAYEAGVELLEEVLGRMGMDRAWTAEDDSDILWWPSPLMQRLDVLAHAQGIRLSATTDLIRVNTARLASEGPGPIEALLSDVNYRFGSRSAWWLDNDEEEDLGPLVRATTSVAVTPGGGCATQLFAAAAVLQAWEAMNVLTLIGDAAPELGVPCLSEHPVKGARLQGDPVVRMVQRDLHDQQAPAPPTNVLDHLAALPLWGSCAAQVGRLTAAPLGCEGSTVGIWVEGRHTTFGGGVYFEARPALPVLGADVQELAGVLNRLSVLDLLVSLGGAWSVNERQELVYRCFWPSTFTDHPALLAETAREVVAQCLRAEQFV